MSARPEVSVIVVSYNARHTIENCLKSLERQRTSRRFEIILVDSSTDGTGELVEKQFPLVRLCRFAERKFPGDARNIAISLAQANLVAFLDADCLAAENWIEEIAKAHGLPYLVIGGAIGNANPESYVGWAAYFCEFSQWMPGTRSTWLEDIAAANISYKKEIFAKYGGFLEGTYCSDTDFHWRLGEHGHRLRFFPSMLAFHTNISNLSRFLKHEYFHGRSFARVRIQNKGFSRWKRMVYVALCPLIPVKLFLQVSFRAFTTRLYLPEFLKASPLLAVGIVCWSLGEVAGYAGR